MKKVNHSHNQGAFTLVEVLVVIGVIALLISILLPALSRARESASNVKCLANLHSMGSAMIMYISNNKGVIPSGFGANLDSMTSNTYGNSYNNGNFDDVIATYMPGQARNQSVSSQGLYSSGNVFVCPSDKVPVMGNLAVNYACSCGASQNGQNTGAFAWLSQGASPQPFTRITQLRRTTEIIAIGDANQNYNDGQSFVDGGSWKLLNYDNATSAPYSNIASAPTYNAYCPASPQAGQKICVQGGNEDQVSPGVYTGLRYRHFEHHHDRDGTANVLFFDGHCAGIRFGDLVEKNIATLY